MRGPPPSPEFGPHFLGDTSLPGNSGPLRAAQMRLWGTRKVAVHQRQLRGPVGPSLLRIVQHRPVKPRRAWTLRTRAGVEQSLTEADEQVSGMPAR